MRALRLRQLECKERALLSVLCTSGNMLLGLLKRSLEPHTCYPGKALLTAAAVYYVQRSWRHLVRACMPVQPAKAAGEGGGPAAPDQAPPPSAPSGPPLLSVAIGLATNAPDAEPWAAAELSADGEHAAGGTAAHVVCVYDMMEGVLAKVLSLEGAPLGHPCQP